MSDPRMEKPFAPTYLRQRHTTPRDSCELDNSALQGEGHESSTSATAWQKQLSDARRMMADRVRKQQEDEGWMEVDAAAATRAEAEHLTSDHAPGEVNVSTATADTATDINIPANKSRQSSLSSEEEEEEAVKQLLRPNREQTTRIRQEIEDDDSPQVAPGAFQQDRMASEPPKPIPIPVDASSSAEDNICRICFDGDDEELGRLFSPCLCRGTSRFVHVVCLDKWRAASAGASSYYKCDQCGYEYKLNRTRIAGLAGNKAASLSLTALLFGLLVFLSGFIASYLIDVVEERSMRVRGPLEDLFISDHVIMGEAVREAVSFFGSQIEQVKWPGILDNDGRGEEEDNEGPNEEIETGQRGGIGFWHFLNSDKELRGSAKASKRERSLNTAGRAKYGSPKRPSRFRRTVEHMIKGMSLIGLASFSTALISPFGLRGSLFRAFRPGGRRQAGADRADQPSFSQIVLVLIVLVGVWKAVMNVYKGTRYLSKRALSRVENIVMDV